MNRHEKEQVIDALKDTFAKSEASFLVSYKGLTVKQLQELRRKLRTQGGSLKVTKARLMRRAVEGLQGIEALSPYFKEQIALVFAPQEAAPIAKVLVDFSKENPALTMVIGCAENALMDAGKIGIIASLPSREVLLAQLCGVLLGPVAAFARVVNQIKEQAEKKA